ncbi:hypothetical protein ColKHC_03653 [Colletotrichum higginsianum]|nr:hypothetical protein ColKHC_03653 [Colletotrichum higginsianum]
MGISVWETRIWDMCTGVTYEAGVDLLQVGDTEVAGVHGDLALEDLDGLLDTLLAEDVGEHEGAAETDGLDAEGKELEDVGAVADTTVGVDLDLLEDGGVLLVDLEGDLEGGGRAVELAATVVGDDDGGDVVLDGGLGVLDGHDALEDDGEVSHGGVLAVHVPGDEGQLRVCGADAEAGGTVAVAVSGGVNGVDDGLGARGLDAVEDDLELGDLRKGGLDVGDVDHGTGTEAVAAKDLEVVAVRPLAGGTVTVVGVVAGGQVVAGSVLEVRDADHLLELGESTDGEVGEGELDGRVGLVDEGAGGGSAGRKGGDESSTHVDG